MILEKLKPWYTIEEIAYVLKLDYDTALKLLEDFIPYFQIEQAGGQYRVDAAYYEEFITDNLIFPRGDRKYRIRHYCVMNETWTREEQMVTVEELADYLQVDYSTAFRAVQLDIPHIVVEGHHRMFMSDVNDYLQTSKVCSSGKHRSK